MDHTFECSTATATAAGSIRAGSDAAAVFTRNAAMWASLERRYFAEDAEVIYQREKAVTAVHSPQCACQVEAAGALADLYG